VIGLLLLDLRIQFTMVVVCGFSCGS